MLLAGKKMSRTCMGEFLDLARALIVVAAESGGTVATGAEPQRILVENGRVSGVEPAGGERIGARAFVASGLNREQTFLDLLDRGELPGKWRRQAEAFRDNLVAPLESPENAVLAGRLEKVFSLSENHLLPGGNQLYFAPSRRWISSFGRHSHIIGRFSGK